jgi:chromosome partitioning protein
VLVSGVYKTAEDVFMRTLVVAIQKGGTGKTTTVQHLGHALAQMGCRVLLVDVDKQRSLTYRYDVSQGRGSIADVLGTSQSGTMRLADVIIPTHQENLWLVPGSLALEDTERGIASRDARDFILDRALRADSLPFDYILIDTPPGYSLLLLNALVASDEVVVPVQTTPMGSEGFTEIHQTIQRARGVQDLMGSVKLYLRAVLPTFYRKGVIIHDTWLEALQNARHPDYGDEPMPLASVIPFTTLFEKASAQRKANGGKHALTIFDLAPDHPGARGYRDLARIVDV